MLKVFSCIALMGITFAASPAFALFTNGGFEAGNLSGWTVESGYVASTDTKTINWYNNYTPIATVINSSSTMPGQTADINPYGGNYMARINDIYGGSHATRLFQEDKITQNDIDNGGFLYVNWGAALIEPSNAHPEGAQPFFGITVTVNGNVEKSFFADALDHAGWTNAGSNGGTLWYKADQFSFDLSSFSLNDVVKIELFAADCSWSGHGGYAFLDGIGTIKPPLPEVPEPTTLLLFATGLVGLTAVNRRRTK